MRVVVVEDTRAWGLRICAQLRQQGFQAELCLVMPDDNLDKIAGRCLPQPEGPWSAIVDLGLGTLNGLDIAETWAGRERRPLRLVFMTSEDPPEDWQIERARALGGTLVTKRLDRDWVALIRD